MKVAEHSFYDPTTGEIVLHPFATLFTRFHELAHKEQHETRCVFWRIWCFGRWIRGVQWLATLLLELDANRRARRNMIALDLWNPQAETEARQDLRSYFTRKPV